MSRVEFSFTAYGEPAPQGSKRHVGNGRMIEASKKVKPWRSAVAAAIEDEFDRSGDRTPFSGAVAVRVEFMMPKPKSVRRLFPTVSPDLDKLCRSLGDAMSVDIGLLTDDALIVGWHASKVYVGAAWDAGARVSVRLVTGDTPDFWTHEDIRSWLARELV